MLSKSHIQSHRTAGVALVVISATVFSTAGIFTNGVTAAAWAIIFWRGLAAAGFTLLYLLGRGRLRHEMHAFGWPALLVALLMAAGTAAFIPAFKLSSVANVALIYSATPFAAAGLAWLFLREVPTRQVICASIAAMLGVAIIVSGSLGSGALSGDALAGVMTLMMAGAMVVYRAHPDTTAALPNALSSILLLPVALMVSNPLETASSELPWLLLFGLVFAVASVTLSEGARRLPPGETALLSALEVPLAPLLALAILGEAITPPMILGGAIILGAVLWSQTRATGDT